MKKRVGDTEYVEWAVEYEVDGETFVTQAEDEDDARVMCAALKGQLVTRMVYETSWTDPTG